VILKQRKLVTVVIESGLARRLEQDLMKAGAKGFTTTMAHGAGPRNQRASDIEGGNVRIESVVSNEVLDLFLEKLKTDYFPHYAVSCWISQVEVVRDERY
jgi:nitrogen regulatory protein P-II 2